MLFLRKNKTLKGIMASLISLIFVACDAPAPTRAGAQPYAVISEQADPASGTLILLIRVPGPITQASVKAIAESAISERKATYPRITVKLYTQDQDANAQPVAISTLEGGSVSHRFNLPTESERIQTH